MQKTLLMDGTGPTKKTLAVRCHDVTGSLAGKQVADFDQLLVIGMAVRLALHLRGVPVVPYDLLRQVGLHLLHIPPTSMRAVVRTLADAGFLRVDQQGNTIQSVIPNIPYYEDLFEQLGEVARDRRLSEAEHLTVVLLDRLARSPALKDHVYQTGAEKKLVDRMLAVGQEGGYLISRRSRGRDVLLSPLYHAENPDAFADLVAGRGHGPVSKVLSAIGRNQGWPLRLIERHRRIGETQLSDDELTVVAALAGHGFASPPAIKTTHAGTNYFLFGPRPGAGRVSPMKRPIYETALALLAAVRQGQMLPARYSIRHPRLLLLKLRDRKYLRANTEAYEQYQKLATLRLGRLVRESGRWHRFELIDTPENIEAVDMALALLEGEELAPSADEDVVLAFHKGQTYVESLVGRQMLVAERKVELDPEAAREIDDLLLRGSA